jgi:small subunit ribosomal protein S15
MPVMGVTQAVARRGLLPHATALPRALGPPQLHHPQQQQQQQQRYAWTKAKKKRYERHERRAVLAKAGIALPTPPYYTAVPEVTMPAAPVEVEADTRIAIPGAPTTTTATATTTTTPMLRYHMTDLRMSDRVRQLLALTNGNQRQVVAAQKQQGMQLFQLRPGDTGSTPVQILALTTRIQQLQTHMGRTKGKDKHSKRGMDALYVRRRKLLDYLERKDFPSYRQVVQTLGLARGVKH